MAILIKNLDVPKSCSECHFHQSGYPDWCDFPTTIKDLDQTDVRPHWCPLIPVASHGRLIDVDAMEREMSNTVQGNIRSYPYSDTTWETAFLWLDHQPTVFSADCVKNTDRR